MKKCLLPLLLLAAQILTAAPVDVYFGTRSDGIYHSKLNSKTGKLSPAKLAAEIDSPAFLTTHPELDILYAVGQFGSRFVVASFQIGEGGALELLNSQQISDSGGVHLAVHPSGKFLLTAQYRTGSVALFPLEKDGRIMPHTQHIQHEGGSKVVAKRQDTAHPHWVGFSPDERFAFVPDLGLDQIVVYQIQADKVSIKQVGEIASVPGGGPRHMKFSVDGKFIFLLNELEVSASTFAYDAESGRAELLSTTPTLSERMKAKESFVSASEILVHPNGKFIYTGNRGHDSVTVLQVDPESGRLYVVEIEPIRGAWPQNINMDAAGRWLLAVGTDSDSISVFKIDPETGELTFFRRGVVSVPKPVCILVRE